MSRNYNGLTWPVILTRRYFFHRNSHGRAFFCVRRARLIPRRNQSMMRPATNRTRQNGTVRCAIYTRKSSEEGLEQNSTLGRRRARPARPSQQPTARGAGFAARELRRSRVLRRHDGAAASAAVPRRHHGGSGRHRGRLQDRPADPLARRFCQDRRNPRCPGVRPLFR